MFEKVITFSISFLSRHQRDDVDVHTVPTRQTYKVSDCFCTKIHTVFDMETTRLQSHSVRTEPIGVNCFFARKSVSSLIT